MSDREEMPTVRRALCYGLFQFPIGLLIPPLTLMLPAFYAETMGVSLAAVGTIGASARLLHVITDPAVGILSDRTATRFGRRLPWIACGSAIALVGIFLAFVPVVSKATPLYLALSLLLIYTATSLIQIPYYAWGAEMTATANGRARMLGWREAAGLSGVMLSSVAPLIATALGFSPAGRKAMAILACCLVLAIPLCLAVLLGAPREVPYARDDQGRRSASEVLKEFWSAIASNPPYRRMLVGVQLINIGLTAGQAVQYFYLTRILHLRGMFGPVLLIGGVCAVLSTPLWIEVGKRIPFHVSIATGCIAATATHVIGYIFLPSGAWLTLLVIAILESVCMACCIVLAPTIQAIAIEYGSLKSGVDRAGTYVSINQLAGQVANAIPFLLVFPMLALAHFNAAAPGSSTGLLALKWIFVLLPAPFMLGGSLLLLRFPISRAEATRISLSLSQARSAYSPLKPPLRATDLA